MAGKTAAEQARLLFIHDQLTEAKRAGIDVQTQMTSDGRLLIDVIQAQANAIAERTARQELGNIKTLEEIALIDESRNAVRSAFDNFKAGGDGLKGFWADIFGFMADKLWELALSPAWDSLGEGLSDLVNPSGGGGGGGFWGALIGGLFGKKADGGPIQGLAFGGAPRDRSGMIHGAGGRRQDNIPILASANEFMQPADAVDYYGLDFMEAVRQRRFPRFESGGSMPGSFPSGSGRSSGAGGPMFVSVRVSVDDDLRLRAAVEQVADQRAGDVFHQGIRQYDAGSPARTMQALRNAQNHRLTTGRIIR
jgi:hypothetical protein